MNTRLCFVDIAKGLAIIAIIAGHLHFNGLDGSKPISTAVFLFHVPIFFILSGYFLSNKTPFALFLKDKAKRLLIPYALTCVVLGVLLVIMWLFMHRICPPSQFEGFRDYMIACLYGAGTSSEKLPAGVNYIGAIWFLWALFFGLLENRLLIRYNKAAFFITFGLYIVATISVKLFFLPLSFQAGMVGGFYIYVGVQMRKHNLFTKPFSWELFFALALVSVLSYINKLDVYVVSASMNGPLSLPSSIAVSYFVIMLARLIEDHAPSAIVRCLSFYGENSIVVLCVHMLFLGTGFRKMLIALGVPTSYNILFFLNFTIQLLVIVGAIVLVKRVPYLRKAFY